MVVGTLLVLQAVGAALVLVALWRASSSYALITTGTLLRTAISVVLTALGLWRWRAGRRRAAVEWLQRSALTSLLNTQVFLFAASQFAAVAGLVVDLLLLGVVGSNLRLVPSGDPGGVAHPGRWR